MKTKILTLALITSTLMTYAFSEGNELILLDMIPVNLRNPCGLHKLTASEIKTLDKTLFDLYMRLNADSDVTIVAHSMSTSRKAKEILRNKRWTESNPKKADKILVVCRSGLSDPLDDSYDSFHDLNKDADGQLNISGSNYHVYLYDIEDDLSLSQIEHSSFSADND